MNKTKLLFFAALSFFMASCADSAKDATNAAAGNTNVVNEPFETTINIRYVSMDSISKHYTLAQNIAAQAQSLATDLQTYQAQLQNQLQNQYNQIQQKAQNNGYLSQASYEADLKDLEQKNNSYQNLYAKREQSAAITMDGLQKELRDSIENFLNTYNKEKKYDAILYRDAGIYFNPALDITNEIIEGLNARFTGKATGSEAAVTNAPTTITPTNNPITNPAAAPTVGK